MAEPNPGRPNLAILYYFAALAWFGSAGVLVLGGHGPAVPVVCVTMGLLFIAIGRRRAREGDQN